MIIFDAETDNLLEKATVVHCICTYNTADGTIERYRDVEAPPGYTPADGTLEEGLKRIAEADEIGGHNVHGFDIPVFQKLYPGQFCPSGKVRDSLTESELWFPANDLRAKDFLAQKKYGKWISPQYFGRHSLAAWGERLQCPKDEYSNWCKEEGLDPWSEWRPEMEDYCAQDTVTTARLFEHLEKSFDYSTGASDLENLVAPILARQQQWGVSFDVKAASQLHAKLVRRHEEIAAELRDNYFSPFYQRKGPAVTPKRTLNYKDKLRGDLHMGASYVKVQMTEFNPGSRQHIYKRLMSVYGWKPTKFSPTGEPTVDEDVVETLPYPCAPLLTEYLLLEKRLGQLVEGKQAWLRQEKDGRLHGRVKANGTRTGRCSHVSPNLGQVPKVSKPYGKECRALFGPSPGRVQMGVDLAGIEMRAQGHYLARFDGGYFSGQVVNGDVHELARKVLRMNSRDNTKTFEYAMTYGAGLPKLGATVYADMTDEQKAKFGKVNQRSLGALGKQRKALLAQGMKGFDKLLKAVEDAHKRGWMRALDGRKLAVPSAHSALNTLFQGFGGIVAKTWIVEINRLLVENQLIPDKTWYIDPDQHDLWKVVQMLFIHDETQNDCLPEVAELAGELTVQAARNTKHLLNLKVEIDAKYKLGANWSECH